MSLFEQGAEIIGEEARHAVQGGSLDPLEYLGAKVLGGPKPLPDVTGSITEPDFGHTYLSEYRRLLGAVEASEKDPEELHPEIAGQKHQLARFYGLSLLDEGLSSRLISQGSAGPIVDFGAGNGYLTRYLRDNGIEVHAYDIDPPKPGGVPRYPQPLWTQVTQGDVSVLDRYTNGTLMLAHPPFDRPMAADALDHFNGNRLVYIGEDRGGYTADNRFFDKLERGWQLESHAPLPRFPTVTVYPRMEIYSRI